MLGELGSSIAKAVARLAAFSKKRSASPALQVAKRVQLPRGGSGVRIEDDILVTATGAENLTIALPRTADDVEAWLAPHVAAAKAQKAAQIKADALAKKKRK